MSHETNTTYAGREGSLAQEAHQPALNAVYVNNQGPCSHAASWNPESAKTAAYRRPLRSVTQRCVGPKVPQCAVIDPTSVDGKKGRSFIAMPMCARNPVPLYATEGALTIETQRLAAASTHQVPIETYRRRRQCRRIRTPCSELQSC